MSLIAPDGADAVIVRADEAEVIGEFPTTIRLLADASDTGGALSTQRVTLGRGADGARPHRHDVSAELFYVLDGEVQLLVGDAVRTARQGDLLVVPAGLPHAFAASANSGTDLLIVITPGAERFEYFRHLERIARGQLAPETLLDVQQRYDTYFLGSAAWDARHGES